MPDADLINLLPEIKNAIEYIGAAATGGIIGNRFDSWFVTLYYHQKQRLLSWVRGWQITEEDKQAIEADEHLKVLFSQVTSSVASEIFDRKLLIWPSVTESLLRNKKFEFNEKQYFISLFIKLDPFTIHYLAKLAFEGSIDYYKVFPNNDKKKPPLGDADLGLYLGQLQSATAGITEVVNDTKNLKVYLEISELGRHFIDFIANSSAEKIEQMANNPL